MELLDKYAAIHGPLCVALLVVIWVVVACLVDYTQLAHSCREHARKWVQTEEADDENLIQLRWSFILELNAWFLLVLIITSIPVVLRILVAPEFRRGTIAQDLLGIVVIGGVVTIHFFAESIRRRFMSWDLSHMYYLAVMTAMSLYVTGASDEGLYVSDMWMVPFRISLCAMPFKKRYFVVGSLLYDAAVSGRILLTEQQACGQHLRGAVTMHAFMTPALIFASSIADKLFLAENKANQNIIIMYSAARRMLDLLADVLLELCHDLCIVDNSPKFAAMLFLSRGTNLAGLQLTHFITEPNRLRFSRILLGVGAGDGPDVGALNVSFVDSFGNLLHAEAFYIHIAAAGTKTRYLIGLRETSQIEHQFGSLSALRQPGAPEALADAQAHDGPGIQDSSSSDSSVASSAGSAAMQYAVQDRLITNHEAKMAMIEALLKRCSFASEVSHTFGICCKKHQAVKDFVKIVVAWQHEACASFSYNMGWQCDACGVLHLGNQDDDRCLACGREVSSHIEQPPSPMLPVDADTIGKSLDATGQCEGEPRGAVVQGVLPTDEFDMSTSMHVSSAATAVHPDAAAFQGGPTGSAKAKTCSRAITNLSASTAFTDTIVTTTNLQTVRRLTEDVLRSWNFVLCQDILKTHNCCGRHRAMDHLLRLQIQLQRQRCDTAFSQHDSWQCGACGVLEDLVPHDGRCRVCLPPAAPDPPHSCGSSKCTVDL
eukprot:TRINITY_DN122803_c0_g1_i1.p1 TRINITY_DN122803_c0_g1~~TRINITY_DN122803_c0_g1_i1.p1  ORF type:complete len:713 (-),score=68.36 TRINITY_DN122803_c0_g1_i1:32-2170(-)